MLLSDQYRGWKESTEGNLTESKRSNTERRPINRRSGCWTGRSKKREGNGRMERTIKMDEWISEYKHEYILKKTTTTTTTKKTKV